MTHYYLLKGQIKSALQRFIKIQYSVVTPYSLEGTGDIDLSEMHQQSHSLKINQFWTLKIHILQLPYSAGIRSDSKPMILLLVYVYIYAILTPFQQQKMIREPQLLT
ncbi:UNVERIFIED_CONTAM: hypothetical protein K2H54_026081 [Gekko kuhli]